MREAKGHQLMGIWNARISIFDLIQEVRKDYFFDEVSYFFNLCKHLNSVNNLKIRGIVKQGEINER